MRVALIRHAVAEDRAAFVATTGQDDALRPLTVCGRKKMQEAVRGLRSILPALDVVGSSPFVRALMTAEILARHYGVSAVKVPALTPGRPCAEILDWLQSQRRAETIALVGHQPDLGVLLGWFLTGREESFVKMKKGSVWLLEFEQAIGAGTATLLWALKASQLARLG